MTATGMQSPGFRREPSHRSIKSFALLHPVVLLAGCATIDPRTSLPAVQTQLGERAGGVAAYLLLFLATVTVWLGAKPEYPSMGPDIYDPKAPAEKLITDAIAQAKHEDKRVLLLFGANWCPWCRRLHMALTKEPTVQARLRQKFVLVFIDANTRTDKKRNAAVIEKYGKLCGVTGSSPPVLLGRQPLRCT